jgi:peptidoglycan hydrolase-like protein with peptidoglycan-binding domain
LLLKHLLESEAGIRQSALQIAPISKKEAFAAFWTPLAGEVGRVPVIELLSEEIATRYQPDTETLMTVQKALAALGHYDAAIDGKMGAGTRAGIRAFEGGLGSKSDGYLTLWETALLAPTLLEPSGDGPAIEALRAELQAKKDAIRTDAELRLGIRLGSEEPTEVTPLPFAMTARLKAQEARTNALKARLGDLQQQLRRRSAELTLRLTETGRDLAQCACAGQLDCLSTKVELP